MKMAILRSLVLVFVFSSFQLNAITDEDEWTAGKHKRIGLGLCTMALLTFLYKQVNNISGEFEENGQLFCNAYAPGIDSLDAFIAISGVKGAYCLLCGFTGWRLENVDEEDDGFNLIEELKKS